MHATVYGVKLRSLLGWADDGNGEGSLNNEINGNNRALGGPPGRPAAVAQNVEAGGQFAQRSCMQCHAIEGPAPPIGSLAPPPFSAVANMLSATEMSLRAFLQTPHAKMPNLMLAPEDAANVIAFILSLRQG
jgi:mono/diheme cytochrome c family protein